MDIRIQGPGPAAPFLSARDLFETEHDLDLPVRVAVRRDPDERTWAGHYADRHVLNISQSAATSAMARELALHEFAHMRRYEQAHPSHVQSTEEALFLAFSGRQVERRTLVHGYQIANHMKDIYADDITLSVGPTDKLVAFLESELASAVADRPGPARPGSRRVTAATDPQMTAVNAAFALALLERHDAIPSTHRIYDLAHAAAEDAPEIDLDAFRRRFRSLARDPDESEYRKALVDVTREYATAQATAQAAE
ncbi:DUF5781 family protein [Halobacteriaceae archaeon GCM10025711]